MPRVLLLPGVLYLMGLCMDLSACLLTMSHLWICPSLVLSRVLGDTRNLLDLPSVPLTLSMTLLVPWNVPLIIWSRMGLRRCHLVMLLPK